MKLPHLTTKHILWTIYLGLLAVLLPHTAWAFGQFESQPNSITAWAAALTFEAAIAALTHKLTRHIETMPKIIHTRKASMKPWLRWWPVFAYRYLNAFSIGLVISVAVSSLANLAHAVQYGKTLLIFDKWNLSFGLYAVAFGGILPVVNLIFARVLSDVNDADDVPNPELDKANETIKDLRRQLKDTEALAKASEQRAGDAEARLNTMLDLAKLLFADDKRQRILAIRQQWPGLPGSSIAIMAESSPSYVSEILSTLPESSK